MHKRKKICRNTNSDDHGFNQNSSKRVSRIPFADITNSK